MFEHHRQPLLPRAAFLRRQLRFTAFSFGVVLVSLVLGVLGYHYFEGLDWIDSLENSAMLLGGMGPATELHRTAGKLFASCYALYAGIVFLLSLGILGAPLVHRIMHHFHLQTD
jgi:hypothetical protein